MCDCSLFLHVVLRQVMTPGGLWSHATAPTKELSSHDASTDDQGNGSQHGRCGGDMQAGHLQLSGSAQETLVLASTANDVGMVDIKRDRGREGEGNGDGGLSVHSELHLRAVDEDAIQDECLQAGVR